MRDAVSATDEPDEQEFREASRRLGLAVNADDLDLALAGYRQIMREIESVRAHLTSLTSGQQPRR